jgi:hypothetical protein
MRVEGEAAKSWTAVRLDSLVSVEGKGKLISADTETGEVVWTDRTGETCRATLGAHAIRLVEYRK